MPPSGGSLPTEVGREPQWMRSNQSRTIPATSRTINGGNALSEPHRQVPIEAFGQVDGIAYGDL